jgi:hypothetical protein
LWIWATPFHDSTVETWRTELLGRFISDEPMAEATHRAQQAPTLTQFADRYMLEHALGKKKPRSAEGDRRMLRDVILPRLGRRKVEDITRWIAAGSLISAANPDGDFRKTEKKAAGKSK